MESKMFSRQISLFGKENQHIIENAKIVIVGLGALGSAVAHLLVRMGVKNMVLVDNDIINIHNLSRQHLYKNEDVGSAKVISAKKHLLEINPKAKIDIYPKRVEKSRDLDCVLGCDLIVDGLDNHYSRRVIDVFCKNHGLCWVHGAAIQEKGSVFFFDKNTKYNDIYPENASDTHCDISGVLATTTTLVASLQSQLVINFLLKRDIDKELIRVNSEFLSFEKIKIKS